MTCANCKMLHEASRAEKERYAIVFKQMRDRLDSAENIISSLKREVASLREKSSTETEALIKRSTKG